MISILIGGTQENDPVFDEKLNNAFRIKLHKIEIRREKEMIEVKRKERKEKLSNNSDNPDSQEKKKPKERRKSIIVMEDPRAFKKAAAQISFIEEERKLHEAYQLILSEHVRRIEKMKARRPSSAVTADQIPSRRSSIVASSEKMTTLKVTINPKAC